MEFLVDTGPLLAMLDRNDRHHGWVVEQLREATRPLLTCEAVLSETAWLLKRERLGLDPLIALLGRGFLQVEALADDIDRVTTLLKKYADLPTSWADASLVALSERNGQMPLLTTDSDFRIYRRADRTVVPVRLPPG